MSWNRTALVLLALNLQPTGVFADDGNRVLFDFAPSDATRKWQTVNDGVMGGRSVGRFRITDRQTLEFFGTLSLANNGGFASVRSRPFNPQLVRGDVIAIRVRGDGREYSLNLYPDSRRTAFSYRARFLTKKDNWIDVRMPLSRFVATSFGRTVRGLTLDPSRINGMGILLGDKKAGNFRLEIDRIEVVTPSNQPDASTQ